MTSTSPTSKKWIVPFFSIWSGQAFSLLGSMLVQFALVWWLTKSTGSATVLATASLVGILPQIFLAPVAGALVDRWDRRLVMIVADGLVALATLLLALLFVTGVVQIWHVYLIMLIRAAGGAFHWPAMQASTSLMVPKEHLARIQGFNQVLNGGSNIIAAPMGALLVELLPIQGVLMIDIGTAMLAILPLLFVAVPQPERSAGQNTADNKTTVWQDFRIGLRYVWHWPGLLMIMAMATLINLLLNPAFSLAPLLVTKHFNGQAMHLAAIDSAWGIGAVLGGLILGVWGGFKRRIYTSLMGVLGLGLFTVIIGLAPAWAFYGALAAIFMMGICNPIANGPLMAVIQDVVEPDMQGRVFTLIASGAAAVSPLGYMLAGPIADRFGVQAWFLVGGVASTLLGIAAFFVPAITQMESQRRAVVNPERGATSAMSAVTGD